ncbi:F-box protein [Phytophthora ramorum]|uniref:F-box protein n=1 Tax=Phytophthora ramorum TaxID=164328 RepID=UPI0030992DBB|nr:F-box protein [Phytophthora ramorum]
MLELLAPRFSDVGGAGGSIPVSLDLSATLDVQLVFWERSVTRQLECVNVDEGCPRCKFESFLRGLVILKRRGLLHINGAYVVDAAEPGFALLRLQVEGCEAIAEASNVDEFKFVTSHLRRSSASETTETQLQAIETAKRSLCHIVGCKLHRWKTPRAQVTPERVLPVAVAVAASVSAPARARAPVPVPSPDRIRDPVRTPVPVLPPTVASLTDPTLTDSMMLVKTETQVPAPASPAAEVEEPSFSDSAESYEVEGEVPTEPPPNRKLNLPDVFYSLMARTEANPSKLWSADIPGLDLRLYEHQQRGLSWMMKRERAALWDTVLPHPFNVPGKQSGQNERTLEEEFSETAHDVCGGMLCDEPGLGKTITMLALILLTKGQSTKDMPVRVDAPTSNTASVQLRSTSRGPSLRGEDLVSSAACLIVVPDALVEHWEEQIEAHVVHNGLKTYVDKATKEQGDLPQCTKLAKYDVVITSFSRMAKEWKLHRPPSALETQSISRYGFEDQPDRYLDGSLRGHVSSLLSVHWLRVVVDEGHKLGGRAPTQLMQMSRLLCAERRWVMTEKRYQETGPSCCLCHAPYSRKEFYKLQPGIYPTALDEDGDKRGQRKKMAVDKKRKQTTQRAKKTVRLVNVKRDFWKIESSKIFYMATRVRELKKMFSQSSRGRQRELKVIIFSQYRESIWRTKVAFKQQNIPTADFIALVNPRQRIKNLKKFRSKSNLNVLLLSSLGSHGLDLSFVTHIFLLEEIWDKSVEMQVISRAHRMGASASVVVEQLWMRGTVECQLTSMNQHLFNSEQSTEDGDSMTQPTREEVQESSSADKGSFQKMKYNYILNNLRVLENGICGKENEVRFSVVDENETVIRHGVHAISDSGNVTTVSTKPSTAQRCPAPTITSSASKSPPRSNPPTTEISRQKPNAPEVIVIDDSSSDEEHKSQANESDREDDIRVPSLKTRRRTGPVKQEPVYIEIKDEETESE